MEPEDPYSPRTFKGALRRSLVFGPAKQKGPFLPVVVSFFMLMFVLLTAITAPDGQMKRRYPWLEDDALDKFMASWAFEVLAGAALVCLLFCVASYRRVINRNSEIAKPPWFAATIATLGLLGVGAVTMWLLFLEADKADASDRPKMRIDAIKTAATVVVGTTGAGALFFSLRRHWVGERDRVGERFNKSIDLLANESKLVQVSGLVMLERMMIENPEYNNSAAEILNYFRMVNYGPERLIAERILIRNDRLHLATEPNLPAEQEDWPISGQVPE